MMMDGDTVRRHLVQQQGAGRVGVREWDGARWAVSDPERRSGRKTWVSGDGEAVGVPLASQQAAGLSSRRQSHRPEIWELPLQGLKLKVQEDGNAPQRMCGTGRPLLPLP